jgi:acyl carrier protein
MDVAATVIAALARHCEPEDRPPVAAARLCEDLALDSLDLLDIVHDVETATGVRLPDAARARLRTVADLIGEVQAAQQKGER